MIESGSDNKDKPGKVVQFPRNRIVHTREVRNVVAHKRDVEGFMTNLRTREMDKRRLEQQADRNAKAIISKYGSNDEVRLRMEKIRVVTNTPPIEPNVGDAVDQKAIAAIQKLTDWDNENVDANKDPEEFLECALWWENYRKRESHKTIG
ncbi:MAG: hypothetical protein Q7S01_01270 [bacterium]|nr:hypothetical protein [bacterium]